MDPLQRARAQTAAPHISRADVDFIKCWILGQKKENIYIISVVGCSSGLHRCYQIISKEHVKESWCICSVEAEIQI